MYDKEKVTIGLVIFLVLITSPFWMNFGNDTKAPELQYPGTATQCVESKNWMKANHMQLLDQWRDDVVRNGNRIYTNSKGKTYKMSLTGTCLSCHEGKKNFCDKCHVYTGVKPYCWECHVVPEER